jgi:hypothetical protein
MGFDTTTMDQRDRVVGLLRACFQAVFPVIGYVKLAFYRPTCQ